MFIVNKAQLTLSQAIINVFQFVVDYVVVAVVVAIVAQNNYQ